MSGVTRGFTLIELLLVLAFFGIMAGVVSIPLTGLQNDSALKDATSLVVNALRRAGTQAMSGHDGDRWGVHFSTSDGCALPATKIHVFRGQAFTSATETFDTYDLPTTVTVTALGIGGGCDVEFSRFHGAATSTGTVTLTAQDGRTRVVNVNGYGRVYAE